MTQAKRILVATDFSPGATAAVGRAAQLAKAHGATLCLLHAFNKKTQASLRAAPAAAQLATNLASEAQLRRRLDDLAGALSEQLGAVVRNEFRVAPAQEAVEAYLHDNECALAVVGSRFDPSVKGLGSTASKVIRAPACPVLIVRAGHDRPYEQVLSAVDLRGGSVRAARGAIELFPAARHHLLYAIAPALDRFLPTDDVGEERIQRLLEAIHEHAARELQLLADVLSTAAAHPVTADVASDVPARAILVGAASLPADCVAVGHHDDESLVHSMLGSIAQHVVQFASGDVLVVP
jgi:nucleotide-binding universal stress UspA family protein